jgi:transposase
MNINDLPNDLETLKKIILEKDQEIDNLKDMVLLLRRKKFAPSSESSNQQDLFNELEEVLEEEGEEQEKETITYERKKRGKRKFLPGNLPRIDQVIDLSEEEKIGMKLIGEEISEKLEIEPAKIYVRRIIRKKYAPIDDKSKKILVAPMPLELLPKTMASSSLIAYIITAKYVDALPLYRQEKIFERISADLNRQTMARWLTKVSDKLTPLYNLLQEQLLESPYIQMDETTVQVLKEKKKKATSKSYMWVRHRPGDNPIILYDYAPSRSGDIPLELLEGFSGFLQVDGYDGYARACTEYQLARVGCWDHARRKFFDASKTSKGKGIGKKGVTLVDKLYKIERKIAKLSLEEKHKERQLQSAPLLKEIKTWIDEIRAKIIPKSIAGKAINYTYNEWKYLVAYLQDPRLNISNALIENSIRPFAVGRRNWLFSDSVDGAKASAMFFSLIETAKANDLEPFDYLNKMLEKLPSAKTVDDFEKLLPFKGNFQA